MKQKLIEIIKNDTSYNKSATRYLYKTDPDMWQQIVETTKFLPVDAKPKQRIWHILNDIFERPTCPVTGEYVKWWENRYLETANRSAKSKLLAIEGKYNNQTKEAIEKRTKTLKEGFKTGRLKPKKWSKEESKQRYEKIKKATEEKYGVHSTLLLKEIREKQYQTKVEKGIITPIEKRSDRQLYYNEVTRLTKISWNEHFNKINPKRLNRSEWDLDHIFSIQEGFRQDIPPLIIAHWTNLRMLEPKENYSKGMRCDKTKEQLFEDYYNS
jgi:hypothetical protein